MKEQKKIISSAKEQTDRIVNNLDRERFGTNPKHLDKGISMKII